VASFNLEEYETAKQAFDAAAALEPQNKSYLSWLAKCKAALDSETRRLTLFLMPRYPGPAQCLIAPCSRQRSWTL
jgi:hypothetical protein